MSKEEKNKFKDNIWLKELAFFGLVLCWGLLIIFKAKLNPTLQMILFLLLVIATILGLYYINRAFLGIGKDKKLKD